MIDGTYKFEVDVPFGRKSGTLTLRTEGEAAFADIDAPMIGKKHMEGRAQGDTFTAQGSGKVKLVGTVEFTATGSVSGDKVHIDIRSNKGNFVIEGVRV
ncbi:MAG: hypothetical protein J6D25_00900 [Eggerthellaceae bacterium]|nr:hypothetical protein [Eggerthellaceae bacterium]